MYYITGYAKKALGLAAIDYSTASVLLLISILACMLGYLYNQIITEVLEECNKEKYE